MSAEAVNAASVACKKALIERALGAELGHHLVHKSGDAKPDAAANHRNGKSDKTVLTDDGPLRIEVPPRDRDASFEPLLIPGGAAHSASLHRFKMSDTRPCSTTGRMGPARCQRRSDILPGASFGL
jgi:transposase-like protein